jgi:dihydrofolate synthase/folylpolyglutamate synthase
MNLSNALRYLDTHTNLEATAGAIHGLSLDSTRRLVEVLGDPQRAFPVIHVTGTNGKGSTVRMITELLRASGLSVGTYTSPHLHRVNERLMWDGEAISDDDLAEQITAVAEVEGIAGITPSYFEILTAAAYRWFADLAVDVAVVEVGLLGRFDATNVADGQVAVLTNIGRDHTDGAPGWRARIAEEKVGIVKPGATFVLGETDPNLRATFASTPAAETWLRGTEFACEQNLVALGGRVVDVRTPGGRIDDLYLPVHGAHQGDNAAAALAATEAFFGRPLDDEVVTEAFGGLRLPGRFEIVGREPTVIIDGAHNVDGAQTLAETLAEEFTLTGSLVMVVGLLRGRDPADVLDAMGAAEAGFLVACTPDSPRAIPGSEVAAAAESLGIVAEAVGSVPEAVQRARSVAGPDDVVVVAGSIYVAGPARAALLAEEHV